MKVVALVSGGKDSCFNMMRCVEEGHEMICVANLHPPSEIAELDSYMYQSVGSEGIKFYADALGLPLFQRKIVGRPKCVQNNTYVQDEEDEVEDLYHLLKTVKEWDSEILDGQGMGPRNSRRFRWRNKQHLPKVAGGKCVRTAWTCLTVFSVGTGSAPTYGRHDFRWRKGRANQSGRIGADPKTFGPIAGAAILRDFQIWHALLEIALSSFISEPNNSQYFLSQMRDHLLAMHTKYGLHVCGEGGEYETFVLDCPMFKRRRIVMDNATTEVHFNGAPNDDICPVAYLKLGNLSLVEKDVINSDENGATKR